MKIAALLTPFTFSLVEYYNANTKQTLSSWQQQQQQIINFLCACYNLRVMQNLYVVRFMVYLLLLFNCRKNKYFEFLIYDSIWLHRDYLGINNIFFCAMAMHRVICRLFVGYTKTHMARHWRNNKQIFKRCCIWSCCMYGNKTGRQLISIWYFQMQMLSSKQTI